MKQNTALFSLILSAVFTLYTDAAAQNPIPPSDTILELQHDTNWVDVDTLYQEPSSTPDTVIYYTPLSKQFFRPVTYTNYHYFDNIDPFKKEVGDKPELRWIEQANAASNNELMALQRFAIATPWLVTYNLAWLPHAPKQYTAVVNPSKHTIEIHDEGNDGYIRIYDNEKENYILTLSTDEKLIKLESTGNIELYAKNDIIMHAGHDINASADNDVFIAAGNDMQRTADNDIREHAGNDRSTSIDRNDSLTVEANQFIRINDNKDEQIAHKLQITAENIREEAQDKFLQYSTTHQQKASDDMAINAGNIIDIKASKVKVN